MTTSRNKVVLWIGSEPDPSLKHEFTVRDHEFKHLQYDEFDPADPEIIKNISESLLKKVTGYLNKFFEISEFLLSLLSGGDD